MKTLILAMLALASVAVTGNAQPTTFYLQNFTFNDGGTASGSFTYDPSTNRYSNVNITTTPGSIRTTAATYHFVCGQDVPTCTGVTPSAAGYLNLTSTAGDQTGLPAMSIFYAQPITSESVSFDLGFGSTTLNSVFALEASCSNASCTAPTGASRSTGTGTLLPPEPSMYMLEYFG